MRVFFSDSWCRLMKALTKSIYCPLKRFLCRFYWFNTLDHLNKTVANLCAAYLLHTGWPERSNYAFDFMDRESEFYEFQTKLTHEFYTEFKKMPTEFYFESQYFNFEWKITTTLLHSHRNIQQRDQSGSSQCYSVRLSNSILFPFDSCFNIVHSLNANLPTQKSYSL